MPAKGKRAASSRSKRPATTDEGKFMTKRDPSSSSPSTKISIGKNDDIATTRNHHMETSFTSPQPKTPVSKKNASPTKGQQANRKLLNELIGESSDEAEVIDSDGSFSAQESESEDDYASNSSDSSSKPQKSRKTSAQSTPSRPTRRVDWRLVSESPARPARHRTTGEASREANIAIDEPISSSGSATQQSSRQDDHANSLRPKADTTYDELQMNKLSNIEEDSAAWFSPNKKPDYQTLRDSFHVKQTPSQPISLAAKNADSNLVHDHRGPYYVYDSEAWEDSDVV